MKEEKYIVKSPWADVQIPEMNLADFVWENIEQHGTNEALVSTFSRSAATHTSILLSGFIFFIKTKNSTFSGEILFLCRSPSSVRFYSNFLIDRLTTFFKVFHA